MQPMHETWESIVRGAARRYAIGEEAALLLVLLAAGLTLLSFVIGGHVFLKGRGGTVSLRRAASHLMGFVWILPVLAVLAMLVVPAVVYFRVESAREQMLLEQQQRAEAAQREQAARAEAAARENARTGNDPGVVEKFGFVPSATSEALPAWVEEGETRENDSRLLVVSGKQYSEVERAREDALQEAVRLVKRNFERTRGVESDWTLPASLVTEHAVRNSHVAEIARSTERNPFLVYRAYYQVELSPEVRQAVYSSWREQVVKRRIGILGGLLAFVTLMMGTATTYLRLDTMTGGSYRRRLKLASVSLLVAGGLGLALLLPV